MSRRHASGFTLLEVMLAFALLAVGLGLLVAIQSSGLRQVRQGASISEASLHAQSLLDAVGVMAPITPGTRSGEFDDGRYRWEMRIEASEDPALALAAAGTPGVESGVGPASPGPVLYRITLDVRGQSAAAANLHFVTLRARQPLVAIP